MNDDAPTELLIFCSILFYKQFASLRLELLLLDEFEGIKKHTVAAAFQAGNLAEI